MKKGVVLDWDCFGPNVPKDNLNDLNIDWTIFHHTTEDQVDERLKGKEIAIVGKVLLKKKSLFACKDLKLICEAATGYDNIDLPAAKELGISVCNVPAYSTDSVAQITLFLILSLLCSAPSYQDAKKQWSQSSLYCLFKGPIYEAKGKTIGIVGAGRIGKEVGRLCHAFGMNVLFTPSRDPKKSFPAAFLLEKILPNADLISLHIPLTPETHHLFNEKRLFEMKKGAFLINTGRGKLIEEHSLAKALKEGHLAGAALDVLSEEPPLPSHPLLDPSIPNLILTPHIAWSSCEARKRLIDSVVNNIRAYLKGHPINIL